MTYRNVILLGDVREKLRELPDESVHCVVTSPPYWGLRDYGTASWDGGDAGCDHVSGMARNDTERETPGGKGGSFRGGEVQFTTACGKCGARRIDNQLGLEPTPEEFVCNLVDVFREVRRVLRSDGTVWLNLGDSYAGNRSYQVPDSKHRDVGNNRGMTVSRRRDNEPIPRSDVLVCGLKPKDLVGQPWRVAFALQADGWWLRSDIIWSKPNPMPESVYDRPTKAHEYVFLLSKSARYFYDAEAVKEASAESTLGRVSQESLNTQEGGFKQEAYAANLPGRKMRDRKPADILKSMAANGAGVLTRNRRTVWEIPTEPYAEAHFATYPTALVLPCIKAGTSEHGCCGECGAPWRRVTEVSDPEGRLGAGYHDHTDDLGRGQRGVPDAAGAPVTKTVGWAATCKHHQPGAGMAPAVVLDPFMGSGTTAVVAKGAGRDYVGVELNPEYLEMAKRRIGDQGRLL